MNHRVLELLKAPKNIQSEDLDLLKEEINSFPYIQNIRALYLYGVHLHDKENYQKVLSTTAAYTTDKKILYQLINGKIQQKPKPEIQPELAKEKIIPAENPLKVLYQSKATGFPIKREEPQHTEIQPEIVEEPKAQTADPKEESRIHPDPKPEIKHLYVNGERNRILFEGEEDFLDDDTVETIDLESTLESGSIVTQKAEIKQENIQPEEISAEIASKDEAEEIEEFTPETIIEEEKIASETEKEEILDESQLSFHETAPFMAENQIDEVEEEKVEVKAENIIKAEETADFTPEKIINEDKISSEEEEKSVRDDEELSFHGMESFLPEVKINANAEEAQTEIPKTSINKHEDEMRRLIEEVEKKMKEKAASQEIKKQEEPEDIGHDISFAETQSFEVKPIEPEAENRVETVQPEVVEEPKEEIIAEKKETPKEETPTEAKSTWKPMSFESNLPDSLLNKSAEIPQPKAEPVVPKTEIVEKETEKKEAPKQEEILPEVEEIPEFTKDKSEKFEELTEELQIDKEAPAVEETSEKQEVPVMNVSFFGSDIAKWMTPEPAKEEQTEPEENVNTTEEIPAKPEPVQPTPSDSNIPGFINTWQSWLKIDRTPENEKEKLEVKSKVIENFIENNPKISQLKEESSFVVREKGDDISHLMTETLANLYFEQKLYTKAIKAFETLIRKTPEKKAYYETRIQEIKDFRTKG